MRQMTLVAVAIAALLGCDSKDKDAAKAAEKDTASSKDGSDSKDAAKDTGKENDTTAHPKTAETKDHSSASGGKHPWASFKPGSFTKMKTVSETEVGGNKHKTESTITYTLKDVTSDEAIVETEMVVGDAAPRMHEMKIPLHAPDHKSPSAAHDAKSGTESVTVAGKHLNCHWTETETEAGGHKVSTKVYINEDVPGFTVMTISKSPMTTTKTEVVEYQSK